MKRDFERTKGHTEKFSGERGSFASERRTTKMPFSSLTPSSALSSRSLSLLSCFPRFDESEGSRVDGGTTVEASDGEVDGAIGGEGRGIHVGLAGVESDQVIINTTGKSGTGTERED